MEIAADASSQQYAVFGHPIAHSWSPFIHGLFARQTGRLMTYRKIDAPPETFLDRAAEFFQQGGQGGNITAPHKTTALKLVSQLTPRAERAGAVNTLAKQRDGILGDNTDGAGLVRDLQENLGLSLTGRRVLILGAGGATRGILAPLLALDLNSITIANRTAERAQKLAGSFGDLGAVRGCGLNDIDVVPFDLIINATSAGIDNDVPAVPRRAFGPQTFCYDIGYSKSSTPFTRMAQRLGCQRVTQGWGMLVEQAAESFNIWHGVRPDTAGVIAVLTAE